MPVYCRYCYNGNSSGDAAVAGLVFALAPSWLPGREQKPRGYLHYSAHVVRGLSRAVTALSGISLQT